MDEIKSLEEYAQEVVDCIRDRYEHFTYRGQDDIPVIREWYNLGIEPHYVLMAISEERVPERFTFRDIREIVKRWFFRECRKEADEARRSFSKETLPYNRLEKLYKIVKSVLLELQVKDLSVAEKILSLRNYPNLLEIEKALKEIEDEFYAVVERSSPKVKECRERARKKIEPYSVYWSSKVCRLTERALLRECLKREYGIPEFSAV